MIIGIDLGTTNSAVAVWRDGQATLIPNALGEVLTPSAVSVSDDGTVIVGRAARDRMSTHPQATATSFKRRMGTQSVATLGRVKMLPEELSALVLKQLKEDAEAALGEAVTGAVITVPAYFNDRQRKATRRAASIAGLPVARLLNEPTAAALAYGLADKEEKEPFLVFDLGGGTFDVSIVEMFEGVVEVRASAGDSRLGGDDFDRIVADLARKALDPVPLAAADPVLLDARLLAAAEATRRVLSERDEAVFTLTLGDAQQQTTITEAAFEAAAEPLVARLRNPVLQSLRDSDIPVGDLSDVVLVGGSTRMPIVRRAITRMFRRFPNVTLDPDHAVALGAAIQAGLMGRDAALEEVRLTDVCPFTLGVEVSERDPRGRLREGLFSPIIERNTPIPASRVESYSTLVDNQKKLAFNVYQGEAREVKGNVKLGELVIDMPPRPAGHASAWCRFSYDSSGLLEIDVTVPETGQSHSLTILDGADDMDDAELAKRRKALAGLKVDPREDSHNVAAMARAARAYEGFIGDRRDTIGRWIMQFEAVLDTQDRRKIDAARDELLAAIDAIEADQYL